MFNEFYYSVLLCEFDIIKLKSCAMVLLFIANKNEIVKNNSYILNKFQG